MEIKLHNFFDNAYLTKERAKHIVLPDTPKGKESLTHNVGDMVVSSGKGAYVYGHKFKITKTDIVNGFSRYYDGQLWHRECDIIEV